MFHKYMFQLLLAVFALLEFVIGITEDRTVDFRIMHTSDIHGWVQGHSGRQSFASASMAHYTGLVERVHELYENDVVVFDSGDFVAGTGYSADSHDYMHLLSNIPFDGFTLGNHDLEAGDAFLNWLEKDVNKGIFRDLMITTNTWAADRTTGKRTHIMGNNRFRRIDLPKTEISLGVLGFMYEEFNDSNVPGVYIQPMAEAFSEVAPTLAREGVDVLVLLLHEGSADTSEEEASKGAMHTDAAQLLTRVRQIPAFAHTPVIFLNGHDHQWRSYRLCRDIHGRKDFNCMRVESQCFAYRFSSLDVSLRVGPGQAGERYVSFASRGAPKRQGVRFHPNAFLSYLGEEYVEQGEEFLKTPLYQNIQNHIDAIAQANDLNKVIGCSQTRWIKNSWYANEDSGTALILRHALPQVLPPTSNKCSGGRMMVGNHAMLRRTVEKGPVTINDTYTFVPFADNILAYRECIKGDIVKRAVEFGNTDKESQALRAPGSENPKVLPDRYIEDIDENEEYELSIVAYVQTEKPNFLENGGAAAGIDKEVDVVEVDTHTAMSLFFEGQQCSK